MSTPRAITAGAKAASLMTATRSTTGASGATSGGVSYKEFPQWYMYPPKRAYASTDDDTILRAAMANFNGSANLYVHVPFCTMKCNFCSLFTTAGGASSAIDQYLDCLAREAQLVAAALPSPATQWRSAYVGGGTPSILSIAQIQRLFAIIGKLTAVSALRSTTIEFSPDTVNVESATAWNRLGATGASMGVQFFDDEILRKMNRRHDADQALSAIEILRNCGFKYVNIDLIYGAYVHGLDQWQLTLERAVASGATRVTIYPLAIDQKPGLQKSIRDRMIDPFTNEQYQQFHSRAIEYFENAGWISTGALAYSKDGNGNHLEEDEADGISTLGMGLGARSYLENVHSCSAMQSETFQSNFVRYKDSIDRGKLPIRALAIVNEDERLRRRIILGLVGRGLPTCVVEGLPEQLLSPVNRELRTLSREGLVLRQGSAWGLTKYGKIRAVEIGWRMASHAVRRLFPLQ